MELIVLSLSTFLKCAMLAKPWRARSWAATARAAAKTWQLQLSAVTYSTCVNACSRGKQFQRALEIFVEADVTNIVLYNTAISTSVRALNWPLGLSLIQDAQRRRLRTDVVTLTAGAAADDGGHWATAAQLLDQAVLSWVKPDAQIHHAVANTCAKSSEWINSLSALAGLDGQGLQRTCVTFNVAMSAGASSSAWLHSLHLARTLESCGLQTDIYALNAATGAFNAGQQWEAALRQVYNIAGVGRPDDMTLTAALSACAPGAQWQRALAMLCGGLELEPNTFALNACIAACSAAHRWQEALLLLQVDALQPDVVTFNALISACGNALQWQRALHLLRGMHVRGIQTNIVSFNAAMGACEKASEWQRAVLMYNLQGQELQPDDTTYCSMISALGQGSQWQQALAALHATEASLVCASAAIAACATGAAWQVAFLELLRLRTRLGRFDPVALTSALSACERSSQWQMALAMLSEISDPLEAEVTAFNAAMSACAQASEWRSAVGLLREVEARRLAPDNYSFNSALWRQVPESSHRWAVWLVVMRWTVKCCRLRGF
ncbi:unnamed protein product [Effrenium voratum]|nr:unnamed protein product [Effrenium voratum]